MKLQIDNFSVTTGWAGSSAKATVHGLNQIPEYIAGLNIASLIFKFSAGAINEYVQKTITMDLSSYDEIVFHVWSRNEQNYGVDYSSSSDYKYKIDFGTGDEYYIPTFNWFNSITLDISNLTNISRIRITCLHNDEDYLLVSYMLAVKDELPRDAFQGVKEQLEYEMGLEYNRLSNGATSNGIVLSGTVSGTVGDSSVILTPLKYLESYAVIKIKDGTHEEIHQISHNDDTEFFFNSMYDGKILKYSYTNADVFLVIPVEYGLSEKEILLPGIAIWGMNPEEVFRSNKTDEVRDTFKSDETVKSRITYGNFRYVFLIDCEARHNNLIAVMSKVVRSMIAKEFIWVNGKKINCISEGASTFIEPVEGYNEIPKIQYNMAIEIHEEIFDRQTKVKTVVNNRTYTII